MAQKKSLMQKALEAAKKVTKKVTKPSAAKKETKKVTALRNLECLRREMQEERNARGEK